VLNTSEWQILKKKYSDSERNKTLEWVEIKYFLDLCVFIFMAIRPFNALSAKLNPICLLLALIGVHHIFHVSRVKVNWAQRTGNKRGP